MKRIKVWADIDSTGLFDEKGEYFLRESTNISFETWQKLQEWVKRHESIVSMDSNDRLDHTLLISELDKEGLELLAKIKHEWQNDLETREPLQYEYFSEGLLKFLT